MITTETLTNAANRLYKNVSIECVDEGGKFHWNINTPDPEEVDEDITIAKLYEDFTLEILYGKSLWYSFLDLEEIWPDIREKSADKLLMFIDDAVRQEIIGIIDYNKTLLDYFE